MKERQQGLFLLDGGSTKIWGVISWNRRSPLIFIDGSMNAQKFKEEVLEALAIHFGKESISAGSIFQDDSARPQRVSL